MLAVAHKVTLVQSATVAAAGAVFSSTVAAAAVAGLFAIVNTIINLAFENRRAAAQRRRFVVPVIRRKSAQRRSLIPYCINGLTGVISSIALFIAVIQLSAIQQSRARSATDTCYLFRAVVLKASANQHHTLEGEQFLTSVGLNDCQHYGHTVTAVK